MKQTNDTIYSESSTISETIAILLKCMHAIQVASGGLYACVAYESMQRLGLIPLHSIGLEMALPFLESCNKRSHLHTSAVDLNPE